MPRNRSEKLPRFVHPFLDELRSFASACEDYVECQTTARLSLLFNCWDDIPWDVATPLRQAVAGECEPVERYAAYARHIRLLYGR